MKIGIGVKFFYHPVPNPGDDAAFIDAHPATCEDIFIFQIGEGNDMFGKGKGTEPFSHNAGTDTGRGACREKHELSPADPVRYF